jgi:myo-inositol 2-dehydrogenase/D-chiro-inositol 1-dehydrogenase
MGLGIGVVGAGAMGGAHVHAIATGLRAARVVAISDVDAERASRLVAEVGGARVHADARELIGDPDVDAVIVASSDATHEALVLACLEAGKPVLCEKPLAATADASLRVVEAEAATARRLVHVGFQRRHDLAYVAVKERLDRGAVGAALMLHCTHRNATIPATYTSGMLITSSVIHEIDVTRWLLGEEIVSARVDRPRRTRLAAPDLQDPQFVVLRTQSGVLVDVEVFVNARRGYEIRCEVVGERGTLSLADHGGPPVSAGFRARFAGAYRRELQAWVDAIEDGVPAGTGAGAWDGYAANVVADACLQSLATGRTAGVRLASRPALYAAPDRAPA